MENGTFVLAQMGASNRFAFTLENGNHQVVLTSQLRQMKPMCFDEISWIRKIAEKDSSYERLGENDACYYYVLRAGDGHELGRGSKHATKELLELEIASVNQYAPNADFIDNTPEEQRIKVRDYVIEKSDEILKEKGISFG
jgi:uncharacterized protein YegP (UPF0339 family)